MTDQNWWEAGPAFSTRDRGGKITVLAPGAYVRSFSAGLAVLMLLTAAAWAAVLVLWLPREERFGRPDAMIELAQTWWWVTLLMVSGFSAIGLSWATFAHGLRLLHQITIAVASVAVAVALGVVAGCAVDGFRLSTAPVDDDSIGPDGTIPLIFMGAGALTAVGVGVWLPFAVWRARRRGRTITSLREHGTRHQGEVISIGRRNGTLLGRTQFKGAEVAYAGERVTVAMSTTASRVPLPGFPVIVYTGAEDVHVDPDTTRPWHFDPDTAKYSSSADGGGG